MAIFNLYFFQQDKHFFFLNQHLKPTRRAPVGFPRSLRLEGSRPPPSLRWLPTGEAGAGGEAVGVETVGGEGTIVD